MNNLEQEKLDFQKQQFEFFKNRLLLEDVKKGYYKVIKFAIILILLIIIVYYIYKKQNENFAPYASILAPDIINSSAGFDFPDQFGQTTDPYQEEKDSSEKRMFQQTHDLICR